MFDMGWAEIGVLFVLALLIFGPDKLPKFAQDASGMVRKLRELASNAQSGLGDQGIDVEGIKSDLKGVADLHPKKIVNSVVTDFKDSTAEPKNRAPAATKPTDSSDVSAVDAPGDAQPVSEPATKPSSSTRIDPDAT